MNAEIARHPVYGELYSIPLYLINMTCATSNKNGPQPIREKLEWIELHRELHLHNDERKQRIIIRK